MSYIKSSTTTEAGVNGIVLTYTAQKMAAAYVHIYATSSEAKREGVSRPYASLNGGIQRRLNVEKVPVPPPVHIEAGRRSVSLPRKGSLTPAYQVCLALRLYATGSYQSVVGELIGVDQSTACRTITRVTDALMLRVRDWIKMPMQAEANRQKQMFYACVIGCIDGTHIRIKGPNQQEHEIVNQKNYHPINVQVRQFCFTIQFVYSLDFTHP